MISTPSVYISKESSVVIATKATPSTVYVICITDSSERDVKSFRIMEFLKGFQSISYCPAKAAQKMLLSNIIPCTPSAQKQLKEIIMNSQEKTHVVVVTRTAEFVGRFFDVKTASQVANSNDICITSAEDFSQFAKSQLVSALYENEPHPTEIQLKNITKSTLSEQLFAKYQTKEITMKKEETKTKTSTATTKPIKADSVFSKLMLRFDEGEILTIPEIVESYGCSKETAASMISNMQSTKYMKNNPTVNLFSGRINGVTSYVLADLAEQVTFDEKKTPSVKRDPSSPPKKGIKTIVRELLISGPQTMEQLLAATAINDKKLISDTLAYLKNPKYCGSLGTMNIIRNSDKTYEAVK